MCIMKLRNDAEPKHLNIHKHESFWYDIIGKAKNWFEQSQKTRSYAYTKFCLNNIV